jgi:hypothetical protein
MNDRVETVTGVTRVEVISEKGRELVCVDCSSVEIATQDDGRTLKIFLNIDLARNATKI